VKCGVEKGELEQREEGAVGARHGRAGPRRHGGADGGGRAGE